MTRIAFFGDLSYVGASEWVGFLSTVADFDVHVLVFPEDRRDLPGVTVHTLPGGPSGGKGRYLTCVPALRRLVRRVAPDVLIAYRVVSFGFSASMTGFHPLVLAAQGQFIAPRTGPYFLRLFARHAVRRADLIHSWAPPMTASLVALGADPARILTLTRGVDERRFHFGGEPPPPLTLVTTRQLEPYYNVPTLLKAVKRVSAACPVRFLIAGEGGARRDLEAAARDLGLGEVVTFLGSVSRERLPDLLRSAHLYVSAVPSDGTSASLLEAMAAGVVPIVTDNESNRHWIADGEGGRLVPAFDERAYAEAIVRGWEAPEWRRQVRTANRAAVEARASWTRNMAFFAEAYRAVAAGRPVPPRGGGDSLREGAS